MFNDLSTFTTISIGIGVIIGFTSLAALVSTFFTVQQRTAGIVQRLGRFVREAKPGVNESNNTNKITIQVNNEMVMDTR